MKLRNIIVCVITILYSHYVTSQNVDDDKTIEKINTSIKEFFIAKGEIDSINKLGIGSYEITDGTYLGSKEVGIYIIRTVYRSDGTDYLLLKDGENFEILGFTDLKNVLNKSLKLLSSKSDEELNIYISKLSKYFDENYFRSKKKRLNFKKSN
jgi:hypothetical protein